MFSLSPSDLYVAGFFLFFFFFKQKTAYEIVSRDWSSDVCSSDLPNGVIFDDVKLKQNIVLSSVDRLQHGLESRLSIHQQRDVIIRGKEIGRASCRERV